MHIHVNALLTGAEMQGQGGTFVKMGGGGTESYSLASVRSAGGTDSWMLCRYDFNFYLNMPMPKKSHVLGFGS